MKVFDSKGNGFVSRSEFKQYMMHFTDEELTNQGPDEIEKRIV